MSLPTFHDHTNRSRDEQLDDRRTYLERYSEAKGFDTYSDKCVLARLAFRLVQAQFKLADISQSIGESNVSRLSALQADIDGWQAKADRFLASYPFRTSFDEMVGEFQAMAAAVRIPDDEEREFIQLGREGRIGEVEVPLAPPISPAWEDPYTRMDYFSASRK